MIKGKAYRDYAEHLRSNAIQAQVKATTGSADSTMQDRVIVFPRGLQATDIERIKKYLDLLEQELRLAEKIP